MKLLFCKKCGDVFKLHFKVRSCDCGEVVGQYIDNSNAVTNGKGISFAIGNGSLMNSIRAIKYVEKANISRSRYIDIGKIHYAWVRPNEGEGNPHTTTDEDLTWLKPR